MLTYHDVLREKRVDLKRWKEIIAADPSIAKACPEHTEELELEIKALEIAIEKEDKMMEWISTKDRLPKPGTSAIVTVVIGGGQRVVRAATFCGEEYGWSGNGNFKDVRAWIEMPEPYEEDER